MSTDRYYLDEKELFENLISKNYLPNIFGKEKNTEWKLGEGIELIIRPQCNQKCKYCYITQHGDKIYPREKRVSNEVILKNIAMILDWLIDNKVYVCKYELYAGDLFADKLYYKILDLFIEAWSKIPKKIREQNRAKWVTPIILMPTNGYFFRFEEHRNLIREYDKKMSDIGLILGISWSTDGLYAVDSREDAANEGMMTQDDYDIIFPFIKEMRFGIHPMIAPENIKNSIKNFDWWVEMYEKYDLKSILNNGDPYPCALEVRNHYWTDEDIKEFTKLIRHVWDVKMKMNDNSAEKMARHLLKGDGENGSMKRLTFYDFACLHKASKHEEDILSCSVSDLLRINVADMSFPICHRVTYPEFNGGTFEIKDNKIVGLIPTDGLSGYMQIRLLSPKFYVQCTTCDYRDFCIKGCFGAQYEYSGEILQPIASVCKLEQAKINTLLELYNNYGILFEGQKNDLMTPDFEQVVTYLSNKEGVLNNGRTTNDH